MQSLLCQINGLQKNTDYTRSQDDSHCVLCIILAFLQGISRGMTGVLFTFKNHLLRLQNRHKVILSYNYVSWDDGHACVYICTISSQNCFSQRPLLWTETINQRSAAILQKVNQWKTGKDQNGYTENNRFFSRWKQHAKVNCSMNVSTGIKIYSVYITVTLLCIFQPSISFSFYCPAFSLKYFSVCIHISYYIH